jgi:predicted amidohydrolase
MDVSPRHDITAECAASRRRPGGGACRGAARASYAASMRIALCQLPVSPDPAINLGRVSEAMKEASRQGADLAVFPEATMARFGTDLRGVAEPLDGEFGRGLAQAARGTGVALVAGVFEPSPDGRVFNTAVAYDASGGLAASYRKIHLFDSLGERESAVVAPGSEPVVADLAGVRAGLATCYDIRFPELARSLVDRGAELIVVPAAWAAGLFKEEHWVTLVRARAIENTVWLAAAGQVPDPASPPTKAPTGVGRSMLVDPMGTVRTDLGPFPGVRTAELDGALTAQVRDLLPSLEHRRPELF